MIKKIITFIFLTFLLVWFSFFAVKNNLFNHSLKQIPKIEKSIADNLIDIKKEIYNPPPLISKKNATNSFLTKEGVLRWTNIQRKETKSLPPLAQNDALDEIAMKRLNDMFKKQYFEHISPDGIGATTIAKNIGYKFISMGENIALGNFKDNKTLVQAWMDSPGHRANILNNTYRELGVAVKKDFYKNQKVWIGVQVFARPLSDCPQTDPNLKSETNKNYDKLTNLNHSASVLRKEIKAINPINEQAIEIYNRKVNSYNKIIKEINSLAQKQKNLISKYNNQVDTLNKCIQE